MAHHPYAAFVQGWERGTLPGAVSGDDRFARLAQQSWDVWSEALRVAGWPSAAVPGWREALEWWGRLANAGVSDGGDLAARFNAQAGDWFARMQQVMAGYAGRQPTPPQIVEAWREALLGGDGGDRAAHPFGPFHGRGLREAGQWVEAILPYLEAIRRESAGLLSLPTFGIAREHQERLQKLAQAQVEFQERSAAYGAALVQVGKRAFELFEDKLTACQTPGRQLTSMRALFDLWIDAAEDAYAEAAVSPDFGKLQGALVNAQMRLRAGIQRELESICGSFGMPTRAEVDAAHRKIAELERRLRQMQDAAGSALSKAGEPVAKARPKASKKAAAGKPKSVVVEPAGRGGKAATEQDGGRRRPPHQAGARRDRPASALSGIAMPVAPGQAVDVGVGEGSERT